MAATAVGMRSNRVDRLRMGGWCHPLRLFPKPGDSRDPSAQLVVKGIKQLQQSLTISRQWGGIRDIPGQHGEVIQGQQFRLQGDTLPTGLQALNQRLERMGSGSTPASTPRRVASFTPAAVSCPRL
jgi:hypothetical protein